mmetsp:Transcript_35213/g.63374  ORF Transcript_35213/g.63374 Transcript_35213/m.63374 type:complete len:91 (-) Transcript_35213:80-352(-)
MNGIQCLEEYSIDHAHSVQWEDLGFSPALAYLCVFQYTQGTRTRAPPVPRRTPAYCTPAQECAVTPLLCVAAHHNTTAGSIGFCACNLPP